MKPLRSMLSVPGHIRAMHGRVANSDADAVMLDLEDSVPPEKNPSCKKIAKMATSAEPPPRWAIGTGQLSCLQFRSGPIARRGGGGIIPFGSASTTLYLLCPTGHARYLKQHFLNFFPDPQGQGAFLPAIF